jgi:hypothetical protein
MARCHPVLLVALCIAAAGIFLRVPEAPSWPETVHSTRDGSARPQTRFLQQKAAAEEGEVEAEAVPALEVTEAPSVEEVQAPEVTRQLFAAIAEGNVVAMEDLFAAGATPNVYSEAGVTPLNAAIRLENPAIVDAILDKGVDTNLPELYASAAIDVPGGMTPLMVAIAFRNIELIARLLDAGADINLANALGDNSLHYALKLDPPAPEIVELLATREPGLNRPAPNFQTVDDSGNTPYDIAIASGDPELIRIADTYMALPIAAPAPEEVFISEATSPEEPAIAGSAP